MADERNFLERTEAWAEKMTGKVPDTSDVAGEFALYGIGKRAAHLEEIDKELSSKDAISGETEIRRLMRLRRLRQEMVSVHEKLRSVNR